MNIKVVSVYVLHLFDTLGFGGKMAIENLIYDYAKSKRIIVPSMGTLEDTLAPWLKHKLQSVRMERVYFDSKSEWLDLGAHLRAMRCIDRGASTDFVLSFRSKEGDLPQKVSYPVQQDAVVETAEQWFGIKEIEPRFRVTYTFARYQLAENVTLSTLQDLNYFALIGDQELPMGTEQSVRVELNYNTNEKGEPLIPKTILDAIDSLPTLPQNNIRLMGFCMLKKLLDPLV